MKFTDLISSISACRDAGRRMFLAVVEAAFIHVSLSIVHDFDVGGGGGEGGGEVLVVMVTVLSWCVGGGGRSINGGGVLQWW
jgi:hypothetical protein